MRQHHVGPNLPSVGASICGALTAMYLVVGRWSLKRLEDVDERFYALDARMLWEPRHGMVLALCVVTLLQLLYTARNRPRDPGPARGVINAIFWLTTAMVSFLLVSVIWASNPDTALLKAYELILMLLATGAIYQQALSGQAWRFCSAFWVTLVGLLMIFAALALRSMGSERLAVLGGGPNIFGRLMGLLMIASLGFTGRMKIFRLPVAVVALFLVVLSGSRGALIGAVAALATFLLLHRSRPWRKAIAVISLSAIAYLIIMHTELGDPIASMFDERIVKQTFESKYDSGRTDILLQTLEVGAKNPLGGTGLGGSVGVGNEEYPHNLFAEVFCEGGVFPLCALIAAFCIFAWHLWRDWQSLHTANISGLVISLVTSQFSGDLYDSRGVFAFLVIASISRFSDPARNRARLILRSGDLRANGPASPYNHLDEAMIHLAMIHLMLRRLTKKKLDVGIT